MIKLTWLPNTEVDIAGYEIHRSDDAVNYSKIADITHDLNDVNVYDAAIGRFYYNDAAGTTSHWYKIRAIDAAANESGYTVAKQAGPPTPDVCVIYGTILDANGEPETEAQVQIYVKNTEASKEGQFVNSYGITHTPIEVFTNDAGFWEADVIRGATVRVNIPAVNLDTEVIVPDAVSAEITTLI